MKMVNVHEAKTHLSRLLDESSTTGEPFIIAKAGKPVATVTAIPQPEPFTPSRLGFMRGQMTIPEDFDTMMADEIVRMFEGEEAES